MPLSFERFQGEGGFGLSSFINSDSDKTRFNQDKTHKTRFGQELLLLKEEEDLGYVFVGGCLPEPTSVLDSLRSPSPLLSHSSTTTTLSSSHGGGAAVPTTVTTTTGDTDNNKCSPMGTLDDVLSPPIQEQSILRLIMDPGSGFGVFDPGFGFGSGSDTPNPLFPFQEQSHHHHQESALFYPNQNQNHNQFSPPPPAKRFNSGYQHNQPVFPFSDPDPFQQQIPSSSSSLPMGFVQAPSTLMAGDDQTVIIEQLFNASELIVNQTSDQTILAQGILARLNHHLNSNNIQNSPFQRSSLYITESLLSLTNDSSSSSSSSLPLISPENLILRIAAYRSFSETAPFLQFVNFTSNQTLLESCEGFDRIHIIDFDIGYGGQWSSLMQELASRRSSRNRTSLKITVFASPPSNLSEEFELRFTEENLKSFALEVKIPFEIELLSIELLLNPSYWPVSLRSSEKEAIGVNLPLSSVFSGYLPLILRYLKQLSPNVVVCSERGCDRNDAPFPNAVIHSLQYYTTLLESLDGNRNGEDNGESVERFWVKPSIEKLLMKRHRWIERSLPWKSLFMQCGFTQASLSSMAESQAELLLQRNLVRGFHVEKRQNLSSLALCWQRKELVTVSAWKC